MRRLPSKQKLMTWAAIALIVIVSWGVNFTMSFGAIHYACQTVPRTPTCDTVTALAVGWLVIQHYLAVILAGFVVGRITGTRIIR